MVATYRQEDKILKLIKLIIIMALGLYPIVELTRLIVLYKYVYEYWKLWTELPSWVYTVELVLMWLSYLSIPIVYYKLIAIRQRKG